MNVVELTKKALEKANAESEKLKEKARDTVTSLSVEFKDDPAKSFGFYFNINRGELKFSEEKIPDSEFEISITKEDFYNMMTQKAYGLILMATGKMKLTKGSMTGINKILPTLVILTEYGKKVEEEAMGKE